MDYPKQLRTLSLCSGYSGIERGIELTGIEIKPIAYVEIEAFSIANLVSKMEAGALVPAPVWTDLKTFESRPFCGMVDLITGGFPCQPFSQAGKGEADRDPRHLFPYIKRIIPVIGPSYVFLENVDGIASAQLKGSEWKDPEGTPVLLHVIRELERMGYAVAAKCYTAAEMGAPHQRRRWFILGHSEGIHQWGARKPKVDGEGQPIRGSDSEKLADTSSKRLQRRDHWGPGKQAETVRLLSTRSDKSVWPMPPGPDQWKWEEPRTMAHPKLWELRRRSGHRDERGEWKPKKIAQILGPPSRVNTKSRLGGTINGTSERLDTNINRVDRLRLLGNGVVPQTAARAFLDLWIKLQNRNSIDL